MEGTRVNLCEAGVLDSLDEILAEVFGNRGFIIVTDETIWKAVLPWFGSFLDHRPDTPIHVLPSDPPPYASDRLVAAIRTVLEKAGRIPIAVGSGTVNDVVKRAAFECGLRYACVPTAPSVDGFSAYGAAITVRNFKLTLECPAPLAIVTDGEILSQAPSPMISAGFADLLAKLPAGADWMLADALGIESMDPIAWDIVQPPARRLLGRGGAIAAKDTGAIAELYQGLIASGLAMQQYRDSRPASGAEHLLSHTWEMSHLEKDGKPISHGFKVSIGSLVSTAIAQDLYCRGGCLRRLLESRDFAPVADLAGTRRRLAEKLLGGSPYLDQTLEMIAAKTGTLAELEARAGRAKKAWDSLAQRCAAQLPSFDRLKADLAAAGCPTEPADIGLSREACIASLKVASLIRRRYTIIDFLAESGILDEAAEIVFSAPWFSKYAS